MYNIKRFFLLMISFATIYNVQAGDNSNNTKEWLNQTLEDSPKYKVAILFSCMKDEDLEYHFNIFCINDKKSLNLRDDLQKRETILHEFITTYKPASQEPSWLSIIQDCSRVASKLETYNHFEEKIKKEMNLEDSFDAANIDLDVNENEAVVARAEPNVNKSDSAMKFYSDIDRFMFFRRYKDWKRLKFRHDKNDSYSNKIGTFYFRPKTFFEGSSDQIDKLNDIEKFGLPLLVIGLTTGAYFIAKRKKRSPVKWAAATFTCAVAAVGYYVWQIPDYYYG